MAARRGVTGRHSAWHGKSRRGSAAVPVQDEEGLLQRSAVGGEIEARNRPRPWRREGPRERRRRVALGCKDHDSGAQPFPALQEDQGGVRARLDGGHAGAEANRALGQGRGGLSRDGLHALGRQNRIALRQHPVHEAEHPAGGREIPFEENPSEERAKKRSRMRSEKPNSLSATSAVRSGAEKMESTEADRTCRRSRSVFALSERDPTRENNPARAAKGRRTGSMIR